MDLGVKAGWPGGDSARCPSATDTVKKHLLIHAFGKAKRSYGMEGGHCVSISNQFLTPQMSLLAKHHHLQKLQKKDIKIMDAPKKSWLSNIIQNLSCNQLNQSSSKLPNLFLY